MGVFSKPKDEEFIITLFMKSGNKITFDGVTKFDFKANDNALTSVHMTQRPDAKTLFMVQALALCQVEGITYEVVK